MEAVRYWGKSVHRKFKMSYKAYLLTYLLTHLRTPWSRVLLQKLTGTQTVKKFPAFYGTRRFITAFTNARQLSLSWARSIQSIPPTSHFLQIRFNTILPSTSVPSKWSLSLRFLHQNPVHASPLHHPSYMPRPSHSSRHIRPIFVNMAVRNSDIQQPWTEY
jgi:hypothetical protein